MKYKENFTQGNHSKDYLFKPIGVVTHHNYLSVPDLILQMTDKNPRISTGEIIPAASYDCVIWRDGSRTAFLKDSQRGWHAGTSVFNGREHCNNFMFGPCFYGNTNEVPLTYEQIESYIEWLIPRKEAFNLPFENVVDHRYVAPNRKVDLNEIEYKRLKTAIKPLWL